MKRLPLKGRGKWGLARGCQQCSELCPGCSASGTAAGTGYVPATGGGAQAGHSTRGPAPAPVPAPVGRWPLAWGAIASFGFRSKLLQIGQLADNPLGGTLNRTFMLANARLHANHARRSFPLSARLLHIPGIAAMAGFERYQLTHNTILVLEGPRADLTKYEGDAIVNAGEGGQRGLAALEAAPANNQRTHAGAPPFLTRCMLCAHECSQRAHARRRRRGRRCVAGGAEWGETLRTAAAYGSD